MSSFRAQSTPSRVLLLWLSSCVIYWILKNCSMSKCNRNSYIKLLTLKFRFGRFNFSRDWFTPPGILCSVASLWINCAICSLFLDTLLDGYQLPKRFSSARRRKCFGLVKTCSALWRRNKPQLLLPGVCLGTSGVTIFISTGGKFLRDLISNRKLDRNATPDGSEYPPMDSRM